MKNLYDRNGLIFFSEEDIAIREMIVARVLMVLRTSLLRQNSAFSFHRCEAPCLMPKEMVNANYGDEDVFGTHDDLVLRPETTKGSYLYAMELLNTHNDIKVRPPLVVWQHGRSFRREQDQVLRNMRLKEFYQLEFQIIYSESTKNDYSPSVIEDIRSVLSEFVGTSRIEDSDRLPSYSEWTKDVVREDNSMEVCSISMRKDLEGFKVLEVAIGTDRMVYNHHLQHNILVMSHEQA